MKKVFRILIPMILVMAIIFCLCWYLFSYDRAFTRDMLLQGARYFDSNGNHKTASWFYDRAYEQADDNDAVAIELASQHKADGNYTQAEATLSRAIEDGGGIDLYIALCQTYVEQDKLLDAVNLLGGITNPEIKAQLDELRPAVPTVFPEPGFYNQYVSVTVEAESGTLYVNPIPEYPSLLENLYTEPVALPEGENTVYAVAVADNGLVSPLGIYGYTIGGIIEEVSFADASVETLVRSMLGVDENKVLYSNDLWSLTEFVMPADASNYVDLRYMPYLETLIISEGSTGDLSILSSLNDLKTLSITNNTVTTSDMEAIGALTRLESLTLNGCGISSVSELERLTGLRYLDLSNNTIRNVGPLAGLTKLETLYLPHNAMTELDVLSGLSSLKQLDVSYNSLSTLNPICSISGLTWLDGSNNALTELNHFQTLTALQHLNVSYNSIADVSSIASLTALTELDISNNSVADITMLSALTNLTILDFSYNQVTALPQLAVDCALITIDGAHNLLTDLEPLRGMKNLNNVFMDYNEGIESADCLAECPVLIQVDVYGTAVSDVKLLTDQSIIVNFDPTLANDD